MDAYDSDGSLLSRDGVSIQVLEDEIVNWGSIRSPMNGAQGPNQLHFYSTPPATSAPWTVQISEPCVENGYSLDQDGDGWDWVQP